LAETRATLDSRPWEDAPEKITVLFLTADPPPLGGQAQPGRSRYVPSQAERCGSGQYLRPPGRVKVGRPKGVRRITGPGTRTGCSESQSRRVVRREKPRSPHRAKAPEPGRPAYVLLGNRGKPATRSPLASRLAATARYRFSLMVRALVATFPAASLAVTVTLARTRLRVLSARRTAVSALARSFSFRTAV
jgi:hypothetical protein